jgi:hypothetical protein
VFILYIVIGFVYYFLLLDVERVLDGFLVVLLVLGFCTLYLVVVVGLTVDLVVVGEFAGLDIVEVVLEVELEDPLVTDFDVSEELVVPELVVFVFAVFVAVDFKLLLLYPLP